MIVAPVAEENIGTICTDKQIYKNFASALAEVKQAVTKYLNRGSQLTQVLDYLNSKDTLVFANVTKQTVLSTNHEQQYQVEVGELRVKLFSFTQSTNSFAMYKPQYYSSLGFEGNKDIKQVAAADIAELEKTASFTAPYAEFLYGLWGEIAKDEIGTTVSANDFA